MIVRPMYQYTKSVLLKVSFDVNLFYRELEKALNQLLPHEIEELKDWLESLISEKPELNHCMVLLDT
ncbi:MAG TPA: hypothetical protein VK050_11000 [Flavobacteriaceae bacterium]|nr:hypothetical protein [Flavobacteriaceae bacterium]